MTRGPAVVHSCSELSPGDYVEAMRDEQVLYRGRVLAVIPELDLIWILDARSGTRQLLDLDQMRVLHCPVRAVTDTPGA
ncbi:MAG TPA: hypothetical protein VIQ52_14200 [Arthrobacter sp.]